MRATQRATFQNSNRERCRDIPFSSSFGIPYQVDPGKWDISATQAIQALKPGASCFSHESSIRTSNTEPDESNVLWSHLAHPLAAMAVYFWLVVNFWLLVNFLTTGQMSGTPPKLSGEKLNFHWSNAVAGQIWLLVNFFDYWSNFPPTPRKCLERNKFDWWSNAVASQIWLLV